MAGKGLTVTVRIDGAWRTLAAFRRLPEEADTQLRDASQRIAEALAPRVKAAAVAEGRQAALMAGTVTVRRDRLPMIQAGGTRRVGRHRRPAYTLLFGSEFGANRRFGWYAKDRYRSSAGRQFRPHQGAHSYWFFSTVADNEELVDREWNKAADEIGESFARDGG